MDYEERYRKLIEAIKEMLEANPHDEGLQNWVHDNVPELAESEDEKVRKELIRYCKGINAITPEGVERVKRWLAWLEKQVEPVDKGEISDGFHTFNELYYYRMLYNAAFFNMLPKELVHKSKKHNDGEECFGGGWFIVMANLPTGQISNHYELKDWDLFQIPEKERADKWDGHTPQEAAERLHKFLLEKQGEKEISEPNWCHHKVDLSDYSEEYRKAYYNGWNNCNMQHSQCSEERNDVVKCLINGMKFYYEDNEDATWGTDKWSMPVKHIIEVLEKLGESKANGIWFKEQVNRPQGKTAIEAIKEVKVDNANKVESNFHEGDWIVVSTAKGDKVVQIASVEYLKGGYPSYITTEGRWFGNGTKARLLTDKDVEITTIPESKAIVNKIKSWSEEDEQNLKGIIDEIEANKNEAPSYDLPVYDKYLNWLKSLKNKIKND